MPLKRVPLKNLSSSITKKWAYNLFLVLKFKKFKNFIKAFGILIFLNLREFDHEKKLIWALLFFLVDSLDLRKRQSV